MRITKITHEKAPVEALDTEADEGYLQGPGRVLADVDVDYQADRRQEVKEYLERRYNIEGRQRVFSAGTFSTMKVGSINSIFYFLHKAAEPFNCLEQDNLA